MANLEFCKGFEVLFSCSKQNFKSEQDSIVCFLHWNLISHDFKCLGNGEEENQNDKASELLPARWNDCQDVYSLRYCLKDKKYLLKIIPSDGMLLVHFLRRSDDFVTTMNIRISDFCTGNFADLESAFKDLHKFEKMVKSELIDDMKKVESDNREHSRGSNPQSSRRQPPDGVDDDPLRIGPPRRPFPGYAGVGGYGHDPFEVGRADLDPFSGGHGGMFMDPMRSGGRPRHGFDPSSGLPGPGRLPPGAVPPGARFDPFGPQSGPGRGGPDPDHMRPPDYDNMFM